MLPRPGTVTGKLMSLALAGVVAAAVGFGLGYPLVAQYDRVLEEIRQQRRAIADYQQVTRQADKLRRALATFKDDTSLKSQLMESVSDGAAVANLQSRMEHTIERAGARLTSVQALPPEPTGTLRRIGVRLQFVADAQSLREILYALEYGQPVTTIDNVFVHSRSSKAVGVNRPLTVRLDVFAFLPTEA